MSAPSAAALPAVRPSGPRVLFVIPGVESDRSSSMIFARRQAGTLAEMGVEVEVFYLRSRTSIRVLAEELLRFRRLLKALRPAVVHAHFGTMTAFFAVVAAGRTPVVITYRGSDLNPATTPSLRSRAGRLLSQLAALRARRIVCVSRELRQRLWWRSHRVTVLASGVDPAVFRPGPRAGARRILGWPDGDRVVLFNAGRDPWNKRLDLALAAARSARRQVPSLRLEVLDGQLDPERMPSLMRAADCLLVTSDHEGSPSVVQEALATNLPVVSVAVGDVPACLEGVTNTRVVGRDPEALAAALVELVREPRRTNGRERIGEFSAQRIARELREIYEAAAKPTRHD